MKLSTGKVGFPIEFDNGDRQTIYFNPNDPNLFIRLKDFQKCLEARTAELKDVALNSDGTPVQEDNIEVVESFRKMQEVICEEIDRAFGGEISEIVFKHCSPFAIVEGDYFIIQFVEAITPEIEKHIKKANADAEAKMHKHIAKYSK